MGPDEKTLNQLASTIKHIAREIKRDKQLDQGKVEGLSKLIHGYSNLLGHCKKELEWDFETYGNPFCHEELEKSYEKAKARLKNRM